MSENARQTAFEALLRVERDKAYSNIILDRLLSQSRMSRRDKAFAARLFYGTMEKKLLLDYNLARLSSKPVNDLDMQILVILRMGLYQLFFADSVSPAAAVNESVGLCKVVKLNNASGFVNAVLRAAAKLDDLRLPDKKRGKNKYYSVKYSCPESIIKLWRSAYGDELCEGILESLGTKPSLYARVNTLKITPRELCDRLSEKGITAAQSSISEDCLMIEGAGAPQELEEYRQGLFHIQDAACQLCCEQLGVQEDNTVADVCSAPGGKSFTLAEMMKGRGRVISCDLYESRLRLVRDGAERLGISIIETLCTDSSKPSELRNADRVLCDVPCSGLGIIRRKPELRYKEDIASGDLPELQYKILCSASQLLSKGGRLVYSTCTLNPAENGGVVDRFLSEHGEFEPVPLTLPEGLLRGINEPEGQLTLFPHLNGTDGFFIAAMKRTAASR